MTATPEQQRRALGILAGYTRTPREERQRTEVLSSFALLERAVSGSVPAEDDRDALRDALERRGVKPSESLRLADRILREMVPANRDDNQRSRLEIRDDQA